MDNIRDQQLDMIMPQFANHAQVGDKVEMGVVGDPDFPFEMNARPQAQVVDVSTDSDGNTHVQLQDTSTGEMMMSGSAERNEHLVFEFEPTTFQNVLERAMSSDAEVVTSHPSPVPDLSDVNSETLQQVMSEMSETRAFANNLVSVLKNMNKDMHRMDKTMQSALEQVGVHVDRSAKFAPMFVQETRNAMGPGSDSSSSMSDDESAASESSVASESSMASSESGSSSMSSEGEDFAQQLLAAP